MIAVLGRDHLGCHARVIAIAFDQAGRPLGRSHAALRLVHTGELRVLGDSHAERWPAELQRLGGLVTNYLALTMFRTVTHLVWDFRFDFVPRQMLRQLLIARLADVSPPLVGIDQHLGFFECLG